MSELVVVGFDTPTEAEQALAELRRMQKEYLIDLEDAVVALRRPDGEVELKQSVNLVGMGAAGSALFVLVRKAQPEKVLGELSRFRGRVLRSSLAPEQEARLQAALSTTTSATNPAAGPVSAPARP